jgi:UDP-3-O-[3-hydroxymyristoyl] glucosamine N-acyltransferase
LGRQKVVDLLKVIPNAFIVGEMNRYVDNVAPIDDAIETSLCFVDEGKDTNSKSNVIICKDHIPSIRKTFIVVDNPRLAFIRCIERYFNKPLPLMIGRVKIHPSVVIGIPGFGFYEDGGRLKRFPHVGGVKIEDGVEIDSNSVVERGALGNTVIKYGTKIGNNVVVGHNSSIGSNTVIVDHVFIGGSVKIGNYCWIAGNATIKDWVKIGDRVIVGLGAVVLHDVPDDTIVVGNPAKEIGKNTPFRRIP